MKANPILVSNSQPFSRNANKPPIDNGLGSSEIPIRFLKHDLCPENSIRFVGIALLWSSGCQVSGECNVVAGESILDRRHGRLRRTWDQVPNDLLSVSRSLRSRTPNAVCVTERSRQPRAKQVYLFFGSALADHLVGFRLLRPVTTFDSTSLAEEVSFLVSLGLLSARSLGGKEGGGAGAAGTAA
jgi:hypothetical protein